MARSGSGESVLSRAVRIFEAFSPEETVLGVSEIARGPDGKAVTAVLAAAARGIGRTLRNTITGNDARLAPA